MRSCIGATILLLAAIHPLCGQPAERHTLNTTIKLEVIGSQEFKSLATSYLGRELRGLQDVAMVEQDPVFKLTISGIDNQTASGSKLGYTVHVLAGRAVSLTFWNKILDTISAGATEAAKNSTKTLFKVDLEKAITILDNSMYTTPPDRLQEICATIVTDLDRTIFEPLRSGYRLKYLQKSDQK
jgi:hypothetical protein